MSLPGVDRLPKWYPYFDVGCAGLAGVIWLARPQLGYWPLLVGLLPWIIRFLVTRRFTSSTAYDLPLVIFLLSATMSIWSAYNVEVAWAKFWLIVGAVLLFYAYANWAVSDGNSNGYQRAWTLALLGGLVATYFLITHDWDAYPAKISWLNPVGRSIQRPFSALRVEIIHPNIVGGVLAMLAPFSLAVVWLSWRKTRLLERILGMLLLALILFALLLTTTRGAWLSLTVSFGLVFWWYGSRYLAKGKLQRRWWFIGVPIFFFVAIVVLIFFLPDVRGWIVETLPESETGMKRVDLYTQSLLLLNDYPLIGAGLGSYMMLHSTYSLMSHVGFSTSSHNMYIDILIDQGIVALSTLVWMWLLMGESVWIALGEKRIRRTRRWRTSEINSAGESTISKEGTGRSRSSQRRTGTANVVLGAAAMSLVVTLVHGIVDDSIFYTRAILIYLIPLAFSVPVLKRATAWSRRQKLQIVSVVALILIIVVVVWWRPLSSILNANMAAVQQSKSELSVYKWPDWQFQDEVRRESDISAPISRFERALEINPRNGSANRRLGQIELSLGEYEDALAHLMMAYHLSPYDNATRQLLGEALIANGRLEEGAALWRTVNNDQNQLLVRQSWYGYIGDEDRQDSLETVLRSFDIGDAE